MLHFEPGRPGQLPEILRFANQAFTVNGKAEDFATLLPKLYAPQAHSEPLHTLLYDGDALVGLFALHIQHCLVGGQRLKIGWIGTVSVAAQARGRGLLARLMGEANRLLDANGCALGVLGGQRQRYAPFGYEYGGTQWLFTITPRNLRGAVPNRDMTLAEWRPEVDLAAAYALFLRQPLHLDRSPANFAAVLQSWNSRLFLIRHLGQDVGYVTLTPNGDVYELLLELPQLLPGVLQALLPYTQGCLRLTLPPWAGPCHQVLAAICDQARLAENHSYRVHDWPQVLNAALTLRQTCGLPLPGRSFSFMVKDGGAYRITGGPCPACRVVRRSTGPLLPHHQAVRLLLGPDSALVPAAALAPPGWLPLPFCLSWMDGI